MTPLVAAWRMVRVTLERQRRAAAATIEALRLADEAGISGDALLEAVRLEYEDWQAKLPQMQMIAELLSASGSRTRIDALVIVDDPIATRDEQIRYEADQGFLAYHCGRKFHDNPYPPDSPAAASWQNGWLKARELERADARHN